MDVAARARRGAALGRSTRAPGSRATCTRCSASPAAPTTSASCDRELYLTATDLDTCERIVFGAEGYDDVPISTAVRASGALPMVYAPVEVKGRELIDGGIVSTTNLDIAVEAGAKLVVVINPLVPFVNDFAEQVRTLRGTRPRRVSDMGFAADRLPGVQAARPPAPARDGRALGGALPGRRHRADRARADRRADVPDLDDELHLARGDRPARLPVGDPPPRRRIRPLPRDLRAPRPGDLREAGAQGRRALRGRAGGDERLAEDPRGHDRRAAAPGRARPTEQPSSALSSAPSRRSERGGVAQARCARGGARRARRRRPPARPARRQARDELAAVDGRGGRPTGSSPGCRSPRSARSRSAAVSAARSSADRRTRSATSSEQLRSASRAPAWETSETPRSGSSSASSSSEPGPPSA